MRKVKHIFTTNYLLTLYYSLVYPYIDYGITLWGTSHETHTNRIFIMQKKAIRMIAGAKYNEYVTNRGFGIPWRTHNDILTAWFIQSWECHYTYVENTSWEYGTFYVNPTDIITQSSDQLNGLVHMENTAWEYCPFYVGLTQYSYNNTNRLTANPHRSYCHSAGNLSRAGKFFRAGRNFHSETPALRESPDPSSRDSGIHPARFPLASPGYTRMYAHTSTQKGRVSPKLERVVTPPSDLPETSASPTRVLAVVTRMFHTPQTITIRPRQTLPDSAGLPPGLSPSNRRPCNKTHSSLRKG